VLVVDGHRIFAEALATALAAEPDVDVSAAGSAQAAERALERAAGEGRAFHVMLVDADLGAVPAEGASPRGGAGEPEPEQPAAQAPPGQPPTQRQSFGGTRPLRQVPTGAAVSLPTQRRPGVGVGATATAPPVPYRRLVGPGQVGPGQGGQAGAVPGRGVPPQRLAPGGRPGRAPGASADGIALVARARAVHSGLRVVVLAGDDDPRRAVRALQAGAGGWVAKESSLGRLMAVVRGVLRDETHVPPALLTGVVRELTAARRDRTESERLVETLTPREKQVLRCMVAGLGRQAVADRLFLSPHTVRTHMQNVLGKLGVHSTLAAVALARRAGVGPADFGPSPNAASG
jgi:DNA-binding NarL/FixJ family response regulator